MYIYCGKLCVYCREFYIATVATRTEQIDRIYVRQFRAPRACVNQEEAFQPVRFSHQEHDHLPPERAFRGNLDCARPPHAGTSSAEHRSVLSASAIFTGEQQQNGGSHQPASHRPNPTVLRHHQTHPGRHVCSRGFQQLVGSKNDGVIDDLRHGDDILVDGQRTGEYDQRTSSHRSGTSLVEESTQPGPGPVLNPNTQYAQSGWPVTPGPATASRSSPSSPSVNHPIKHSNSTGEEGLRKQSAHWLAIVQRSFRSTPRTQAPAEMLGGQLRSSASSKQDGQLNRRDVIKARSCTYLQTTSSFATVFGPGILVECQPSRVRRVLHSTAANQHFFKFSRQPAHTFTVLDSR